MIGFRHKGDFSKLSGFLEKSLEAANVGRLDYYGRKGVEALEAATPVSTGVTARSWYYKIERDDKGVKLLFCNSNIQNGVPVAIILQYGHGTRNGGWVEGRDYINPAIQPIFDELANSAWKEVSKL